MRRLGAVWGGLGAFWKRLGRSLDALGASWRHLGRLLELLKAKKVHSLDIFYFPTKFLDLFVVAIVWRSIGIPTEREIWDRSVGIPIEH